MGLQRFFRSIYFRFCATTLVTVLVVILGYFLFSVYQTTFVLKTLENPEIHVLIGRLEQIYPLGVGALSILVFLMLAAMFDLVYFMENTKQYRSVTRTISAFATKLVPAPTGFLYFIFPTSAEQTVVPMTTFAREFA